MRQASIPGGNPAPVTPDDRDELPDTTFPKLPVSGLALFYDTETTGLPLFKEPSDDPRQPHIVQLGAILVDIAEQQPVASLDLTVYPDGWEIPPEITEIHGMTTARAAQIGVDEALAVRMLMNLWDRADYRVAHNESFDARLIRIALKRFREQIGRDPDVWKAGKAECTQVIATPFCKIPPTAKMIAARRNHYKSANLREAFFHCFGRELEGAHTAAADALGCMQVYFALRSMPTDTPA